ncbi:hypothetical protein [Pseudomonas farris]
MQKPPVTGATSNPVTPRPTAAQVDQGQIRDYELLLSFMRLKSTSLADYKNKLMQPCSFSPLDQENEKGQIALQQLLEDSDYQALCKTNNVFPRNLTVTLKDGAYVYETSNLDGQHETVLNLTGNAKWKNHQTRIEKSVTLLGGHIRHDRLIPFFGMATFYGMTPWSPTHAEQHQAAIDTLEEKIASFQLGLEEDFNILDFRPSPVKHSLKSSLAGLSAADIRSQVGLKKTHYGIAARELKTIIQTYLSDKTSSLLALLAQDILSSATVEQIRAQPTVFLKKILESPEAEKLGYHLLSAMDWYGGKPEEENSPRIRTKVVANALEIWFQSPPTDIPERIAGYDLQARSNWGKSYPSIRGEFETHLLTSMQASSEKEAIVIARLFLRQFPAEFSVSHIPSDLPYRSSFVWVNFVNGVNLINATDPGALTRFNFEQLTRLPLERTEGASAEQTEMIGLARLLPTLDWAVTQGFIPQKRREEFTQLHIERAQSELDKHIANLSEAIIQLNKEPPKRLSIAQAAVETTLTPKVIRFGAKDKYWYWKEHLLARKRHEHSRGKDTPTLPGKGYDFYSAAEVVASDKFDDGKPWYIARNDHTLTRLEISIDEHRNIRSEGFFGSNGPTGTLPEVKKQFDEKFLSHLQSLTAAYATLINNLLASLTYSDRQTLELGELKIYTLRKQTFRVEAKHETSDKILPLRARNGLLLVATFNGLTSTIELLPRAGIIRRIDNLAPTLFGGVLTYENWPIGMYSNSVETLSNQTLPFDWDAHANGVKPKSPVRCEAIIEQLGHTFLAPSRAIDELPMSINSSRCKEISNFIATQLLFQDPKVLRATAYGETEFEREAASLDKTRKTIKAFVPFWTNIEDLDSGEPERMVNGAFGISVDLVPFVSPIGKFAAGSLRLIINPGRLALRMRLPIFSLTIKEATILTLQALNPADMAVSLVQILGYKGLGLVRSGIFRIKQLAGKAGHFDFTRSLPQINDAGRWRPLVSGDQLATIRGIDDVPVRNLASSGEVNYRLVDPLSSKPYGPLLHSTSGELLPGRSHYSPLKRENGHVMVEVAENTRVREILEVDGRHTLFLDDVPYRLDGNTLRRVDLIDDSEALKLIPCRPRRAPGENICINSYVTANPVPPPQPGSFDETKGYALWFGDRLSTPTGRIGHEGQFLTLDGAIYRVSDNVGRRFDGDLRSLGFAQSHLVPSKNITATIEFRKGIYARIEIRGTYEDANDLHRVGAILVPNIDDTATHVFTRVNTNQYYLATVPKGNSLSGSLTFKRLAKTEMADGTLGEELLRVYTGSLNANNIARIHGIDAVERAMKTMEDIAIPIGTTATPSGNMKWLKVDTSPGEALMFDHSTRMIVTQLPEGATTWTRSKEAPQAFRQKTAEIFDTLFLSPTINPKDANAALRIDKTMQKLQSLLPIHERPFNARNIAFAEVTPVSGHREIYVSVSGAQGSTTRLPLFRHLGANHVRIGDTTYINIDFNQAFPRTALKVTAEGKILAVPLTIKDIGNYKPAQTNRPTLLDSESKLISVIREKYPDPKEIRSVDMATTMRPCGSCSVVMKQFGHEGAESSLQVLWN